MLRSNCWTLLILFILPVSAASDEDAAYCKNGKISVKDVTDMLSIVNERRTKLAEGLEEVKEDEDEDGQQFPPAKNMRKMIGKADLKAAFQALRNGMHIVVIGHFDSASIPCKWYTEVDYSKPLNQDLGSIWYWGARKLSLDGNQPVRYTGNDKDALYYANLMRGSAFKIGCAVRNCSTDSHMDLCLTNERNIQEGEDIYEVGNAESCKCDKPLECDGKLCVVPIEFPGSSDEPSTKCSSKEISDTMRMHMQDTHNYRRSLLALGQVVNSQKKTLPAASNMNYLSWDCALEREAHDFLRDCPTVGYLRPDDNSVAQNFYYGTTNEPTFRDMNKKAVTEWWKQVRKVEGPNVANPVFLRKHNSSDIKSYTLMGWASSKEMGCSIAKCGDYWVEACRYYPPGNEVNKKMYKPGKACSKCGNSGKPCDSSLGLCGSKK